MLHLDERMAAQKSRGAAFLADGLLTTPKRSNRNTVNVMPADDSSAQNNALSTLKISPSKERVEAKLKATQVLVFPSNHSLNKSLIPAFCLIPYLLSNLYTAWPYGIACSGAPSAIALTPS